MPEIASQKHVITRPILLTLALLAALAPIGTDLYLPAFPDLAVRLSASTASVQLTLTAFLAGAGVGQLAFGPLSDRVGRRGPLLAGLLACVLAGIMTALSPSIGVLIAARFVQGFTAAAGMVLGRAMVSDVSHGLEAARAMSLLMVVGGVAPVVAPVVGSALTAPLGWRGLMWIIAALSAIGLALAAAFLPETHKTAAPAAAHDRGQRGLAQSFATLRNGRYIAYTITFSFAFATMMAYISASPFVYQQVLGLTEVHYGIAFGLNALALMVTSGLAAKLTHVHGPHKLAGWGLTGAAVGALATCVAAVSAATPIILMAALFVTVGSLGFVFGNCTALALDSVRSVAGTGSAVLGAIQFLLAGLVAPIVGLAGEHTAIPMGATMVVLIAVSATAFLTVRNRPGVPDAGL
ncbi:multidrug effflux MFS transporter [Rarobacter incanus]|uniref:DHA1 family bicyclomycin/chloramphenicol resistance-like MFS transporter n=1 Tax=Rarobacter incanus TaxID=153494 RepID=A0A542SLZ0_9MICO|nr:multidrug effflux MFS transporter [Rarobacter incanus]TQK75654.1 DHA1 family bicyclomycin/chloramphenicol resistance-like MFS transporter [Rarobacter incanus]